MAENQVRKFTQGIPKIEWVKIRERKEELDLVILGLAYYTMLNDRYGSQRNWKRFVKRNQRRY